MKHELIVRAHFDAAHHLPDYPGDCAKVHGHTWKVEAVIGSEELPASGILIDFKVVKAIFAEILPDHRNLNDIWRNPTAENLAQELAVRMANELGRVRPDVRLLSFTVWESENAGARFSPSQ